MPTPQRNEITPALLRRFPLPLSSERGKEGRGKILVAGGSIAMPGSILLTAHAALRAGAGKLQIATPRAVAIAVGVAMPEAYVRELEAGIGDAVASANAVTVGPGIDDLEPFADGLLEALRRAQHPFVLDAAAITLLQRDAALGARPEARAVITPHCGEMAALLGCDRESVEADRAGTAERVAAQYGVVVALKDQDTHIAAPDSPTYIFRGGSIALGTSGSGDVLSGLIGGLLARGASPVQAAMWGVYVHATAGSTLERRIGLGFLARELLPELPPTFAAITGR